MDDNLGTINPAALNSASTIAPNLLSQPSPRGIKRSRSPDVNSAVGLDGPGDDAKNRPKKLKAETTPPANMSLAAATHHPVQTPQIRTQTLPQQSPSQASPQRSTPGSATKPPVVKALPTVRDHTTDQLKPEGDEYIPREEDQDGERKVDDNGYPLGGRKYKCKTFNVPKRGEKLFMLATECARVLGYRDSYLLFNKNRSLYKIIANQAEKDDLIRQEILPYSYRSRQIAIVTARSMFRQFGSRLIEGGRRVRDDYWEGKAKKQGFTEDDPAGEKRPGAAKAREAAAAAEANHAAALTSLPQGEIIYSNNGPGLDGQPPGMGPVSLAPLPMIHLPSEELRPNAVGAGYIRPRQEIAGPPYADRIQSCNPSDILAQAGQAAEWNKTLSTTRAHRAKYLDDYWRRPHEQPTTEAPGGQSDANTVAPQSLQSPQAVAGMSQHRGQQESISHPGSQMIPPTYSGYNQHNPMASPVQNIHRASLPSASLQQGSPSMSMGATPGHRQTPSYSNYAQNQMWPPPQPQPSPLSQSHVSGYGQQQQQQHHSQMPPPQMPQQSSMGYPQMNQMNPAYAGMNRGMYQPSPSPQQFNMGQSGAGQQPGMQGWSNPGAGNMPNYYQ